MTKSFKHGQKAARSGGYEIVGRRGGKEHAAARGKARFALPQSRRALLITKSGKTIIVSPATSNSTSVESWSKAFKN